MKYKNQAYITNIIRQLKKESGDSKKKIIKDMKAYYREACYEANKINSFTAPEEIDRRLQAKYFYEDIFDVLGVKY